MDHSAPSKRGRIVAILETNEPVEVDGWRETGDLQVSELKVQRMEFLVEHRDQKFMGSRLAWSKALRMCFTRSKSARTSTPRCVQGKHLPARARYDHTGEPVPSMRTRARSNVMRRAGMRLKGLLFNGNKAPHIFRFLQNMGVMTMHSQTIWRRLV